MALQEIENSVKLGEAPDEALADLVAGLNAAAGKGTWDYVRTPAALHDAAITDFITNAIIYKPAVVKPSGEALTVVDESVWDIAREPIAQTFNYGTRSSRSWRTTSSRRAPPDPDPQPGQDAFNAERVKQAQVAARLREQHLRRAQERDLPRRRLQLLRQGGPDQGLHRRGLERRAARPKAAASTPTRSTASSARSTT